MVEKFQHRSRNIGPWISATLVSASLVKPILEFWNQNAAIKKASSNAQSLRSRLNDQVPLTQAQVERIAKAVTDRASDLTDQVQQVADKVAVRVPAITNRFPAKTVAAIVPAANQQKPSYRVWWITGISIGFAIAGGVAFVLTRRRMQQQADQELVALPANNSNGHQTTPDRLRSVVSNIVRRDQPASNDTTATSPASSPSPTATAIDDSTLEQAAFIGNIRTQVYHPADSDHLPVEENRIYFRSEHDAKEAGYHPAD